MHMGNRRLSRASEKMGQRLTRKGGTEITLVMEMVLLVGVLCLGGVALVYGKSGLEYANSLLTGSQSPTYSAENLLNAMECSYLRCRDGCSSGLSGITIVVDSSGTEKNCKTDYCDPFADGDGKVCGDNAQGNPVEVHVDETGELSLDDIESFNDGCYGDYCMIGVTDTLPSGVMSNSPGFVWVRSSIVKSLLSAKDFELSASEHIAYGYLFSLPECTDFSSACGAESLTVPPGTYSIWTDDTSRNSRYDPLDGTWKATWGTTYVWTRGCSKVNGDECTADTDCASNYAEPICNVRRCECTAPPSKCQTNDGSAVVEESCYCGNSAICSDTQYCCAAYDSGAGLCTYSSSLLVCGG